MSTRLNSNPSVSCVMPAYNEAKNLASVIADLQCLLAENFQSSEIIIVDDGSKDNSRAVLAALCQQYPNLIAVFLSRNFGKEAAISAGLDAAKGDVVVLMDSDGQHPSTLICQMISLWRQGLDVIYAVRKTRSDQSKLHASLTGVFYTLVNWGSRVKIPPHAGDFRLMDRQVVDALNKMPERNRFMKGLYAWVGFKATAIEYEPLARLQGISNFGLLASLRLALTGILAFSTLPLKFLTLLGVFLSFGAISYGAWIIGDFAINGNDVPGYASLIVSQMFFHGIQLLAIGTLANYVGRIYEEVKGRPVYLIQEKIGKGLEDS